MRARHVPKKLTVELSGGPLDRVAATVPYEAVAAGVIDLHDQGRYVLDPPSSWVFILDHS